MLCNVFMARGNSSRYAWSEIFCVIVSGPTYLESSFLDGHFVLMLRTSNQTLEPMQKSGGRIQQSCIGANIMTPNLEPGVIPFIHKEWCYLGCRVQSIVICKFCKW